MLLLYILMRPCKGISDMKLILFAPTCGDPISAVASTIRCVHLHVDVINNIVMRIVIESLNKNVAVPTHTWFW
jgi:hypothetical protein